LIGHELGHQVNGDQRRSFIVRNAIRSLGHWAYLRRPAPSHSGQGLAALGEVVMVIVLLPAAAVAGALQQLLSILASRQGLSAEYYADELAAKAGGTGAAVALSEKLLIAPACQRQVIHTAKFDPASDPWRDVAGYAAGIHPHEWERQRRLGRRRLPAIDDNHPPSQLRADLLRRLPHRDPAVRLTPDQAKAIDQELSKPTSAVTAYLRSEFAA